MKVATPHCYQLSLQRKENLRKKIKKFGFVLFIITVTIIVIITIIVIVIGRIPGLTLGLTLGLSVGRTFL